MADTGVATAGPGDDAPTGSPARREPAAEETVGPPLIMLVLGGLAAAVSFALVPVDSVETHVLGYLCGSLIPIVAIGLFRRFDLLRRKSPLYRAGAVRSWVIPAVAVIGLVAASLHTWALATRLAS